MENEPRLDGANIDTRTEAAKAKDINVVELVTAIAPVDWREKKDGQWRKFPDQNQDGSGSCVMQTVRKLGGISMFLIEGQFVEMSAGFYGFRSNKPGSGMIGVEAFDIWKNKGLPLECLVESDNKNDAQMDAIVIPQWKLDVAKQFAITGHVGIPNMDFEAVASVIQQTGKGVMVWFYFDSDEWSPKFPVVKRPLDLYAVRTSRHSVAAVDFGLINGKKYIKIEDSAHFGGITERWISEEFFQARNWFNRYAMNFRFDDQSAPLPNNETNPLKPKHTFTKVLEFIPLDSNGNISNVGYNESQKEDVKKLQDILRFEGFFPTNVSSTGYFGATTAKALYNWQVKHAVAPLAELDSIVPKGGRVGNKTITSLNQIYG